MRTTFCIRTTSLVFTLLVLAAAVPAVAKEKVPAGAELGDVYLRWQVTAEAEKCYARALELAIEPAEKAALLCRLAQGQIGVGDGEAALKAFDQAVTLAPDGPSKRSYMMQRADLNAMLGSPDKAIGDYEAVLAGGATPGEKSAARAQLLVLYDQAGTLDDVVAGYAARVRKDPNDLDALELLAQVYTTQRPDAGKLAGVLEKLAALRPKELEYLLRLVEAYRGAGQHEKAIKALTTLAERVPRLERANCYGQIAEEYAALGDSGQALAWAQRIFETGGDPYSTRCQLARLYSRIGEPKRAVAEYAKAIELAPTKPEQQQLEFELADLHNEQGRSEEAYALFKTLATSAEEPPLREQAGQRAMAIWAKTTDPLEHLGPEDPTVIPPD
jgi:tetratricopeptide (TPR) repeat protein